jgi:predicted nucleotidyltransferase
MKRFGLTDVEQELIREVLRRHAEVNEARVFGSRAKGDFQPNSDVDLVLWGEISLATLATIAGELDELPLPYLFDVQAYDAIRHRPLREHINCVGLSFYTKSEELAGATKTH